MIKKLSTYLIIFVSVVLGIWAPSSADASSLNLSFPTGQIRAGNTFKVSVIVNPLGEKIFTAKASLSYPANLLRVSTFTFGDAWMPLNQPGYNEIDNEKGEIIKTAGYPSGTSSRATLGIITFTGLKAGSGAVKVNDDSVVLNSESKNTLTEKGAVEFTLLPALAPVSPVKSEPTTKDAKGAIVPERYAGVDLPDNVPSPDKIWLFTKLAILSAIAFALQYRVVMYLLIAILAYILFRVVRMIIKRILKNKKRE